MQKKHGKRHMSIGRNMVPSRTEAGQFLRSRRLELGLAQADIARCAGISQANYSALEIGDLKHTYLEHHLNALAEALRCEASALAAYIPPRREPQQTVLGKLILTRRQELGLEITCLAKRAGASEQHLKKLERGKYEGIGYALARRLAQALTLEVSVFKDHISTGGFRAKETGSLLGSAIRTRRIELGLSLLDVAALLGVTAQTISTIERGHGSLSDEDRLVRFAEVLQMDPEDLRCLRPQRAIANKKLPLENGTLAAFVFERRRELGLTQRKVSDRMGAHRLNVYAIESGKTHLVRTDAAFWSQLAEALECEIPERLIPSDDARKAPPAASSHRGQSVHDTHWDDLRRIRELSGIKHKDAVKNGVQLLRRVLERQRSGFSIFFAKDGDLVELELFL